MKKTNINEFLSCDKVEKFLMAYIDGELNTRSKLRFKFHLAICSNCRNYMKGYRNAINLGKQVFNQPHELATSKVTNEILNAILDASQVSRAILKKQ